jgi:VWFA-related protein
MVVVAVGVVMTSGPRAEQSPPTSQPAFRTGVELVQVDVSVLDKERQPVQGLTASDFTVREDGKVRPVTAFSVVDLPARAAEPAAAWVHDVAPDVVSNAVARAGRLVVILFDRTVRNADVPAAKRTAEAIVNQLGPADLAAVVYTARGVPQNFTADRRLLLAAIAQPFMGLAEGDTGNPGQCLCGA